MQNTGTDPELNVKKSKYVRKVLSAKFEADLVQMVDEKYKKMNITHEIIRLCGQEIQKRNEYRDDPAVQKMKFNNAYITKFMVKHDLRHI